MWSIAVITFFILGLSIFPVFEKYIEYKNQQTTDSKLDYIIDKLEIEKPNTKKIELDKSKTMINTGMFPGEGTLLSWITALRFENVLVNGEQYLFDLYSLFENKDRISIYYQSINNENYISVRIYDSLRQSYYDES